MKIFYITCGCLLLLFLITGHSLKAQTGSRSYVPTTLLDVFLPGSQPLESGTFTAPSTCDNCHSVSGQQATEIPFNWRGSMMAQAQRDPLYLACLAISNQDAPEVGDLCIRCHAPTGWLEGRSTPTDGSSLTAADRESVQCHFCHRMIAPTTPGVNPFPSDPLYTTPPSGQTPSTYSLDQTYLSTISNYPPVSGDGMYIVDNNDNRRGPLFNPQANHNVNYATFHKVSNICGTCHDVSNPVYSAVRNSSGDIIDYVPNTWDAPAPNFSPYEQFPIERTYSEWMMSAYNSPGGIAGTAFGGNKSTVSTCQDCHMKDVTGKACNKSYAPTRTDLPLHDMTGGNTFVPGLIDLVFPGEASVPALTAGVLRARWMLQHAASLDLSYSSSSQQATVTVTNETAHKLPSGYPEGRRIWLNVKASCSWTGESFESGHYDAATAYLTKEGTKIYEIQPGLSPGLASALSLTAGKSFHFVLNDTIYLDNRIPPRGFTNANFDSIQSPPVGYTYADNQYWDNTVYQFPFDADEIEVTLYYQTVSKEYVEFLRDENVTNSAGLNFYNLWSSHGKSAPEVMNSMEWSIVSRWTGAASHDWSNPANWDGGVPTSQRNVVIQASAPFQPVLTANASCDHLTVESGAQLIVSNGATLTIGIPPASASPAGDDGTIRRVLGGKISGTLR